MEKDTPLVSIILPCYFQGEYLADALNSLLNQTIQQKKLQELFVITIPVSITFIKRTKESLLHETMLYTILLAHSLFLLILMTL